MRAAKCIPSRSGIRVCSISVTSRGKSFLTISLHHLVRSAVPPSFVTPLATRSDAIEFAPLNQCVGPRRPAWAAAPLPIMWMMLRAESSFSASCTSIRKPAFLLCQSESKLPRARRSCLSPSCRPGRTSAARNKSSRPRAGQCCDYDNNRIKSSAAVLFETFGDQSRIWGIDCPRCHREAVRSAPAGLRRPDATWCRKPHDRPVDSGTLQPRQIPWDEPELLGEKPGSHFGPPTARRPSSPSFGWRVL